MVPVGPASGGDGEPDVVQALERVGDDHVRFVLVADHCCDGHLAEHRGRALLIGVGQLGIQPLQHALGDAGHAAEPVGRCLSNIGDQENPQAHCARVGLAVTCRRSSW